MSGWKHSSTKVTFAGVLILRGENVSRYLCLANSIDRGTAFYLFKNKTLRFAVPAGNRKIHTTPMQIISAL